MLLDQPNEDAQAADVDSVTKSESEGPSDLKRMKKLKEK